MADQDRRALEAALDAMREIRAGIGDLYAGVALLHLEAAIAALESQLRRQREELSFSMWRLD